MKRLLLAFLVLPLFVIPARQAFGQPEGSVATDTNPVIPVLVTSKDTGHLTHLSANDIEILENDKPVKILAFGPSTAPLTLGLLIDLSGSAGHRRGHIGSGMQAALLELNNFVDLSGRNSEYYIGLVHKDSFSVSPTAGDGKGVQTWISEIAKLRPAGNTRLFDALAATIGRLASSKSSRRAVIVISDGMDNLSKINYGDLEKLAQKSEVLIYNINVADFKDEDPSLTRGPDPLIYQLCPMTGGFFVEMTAKSRLKNWGKFLLYELDNQYYAYLQLVPTRGKPKWRELKVRLTKAAKARLGNPMVRARKGVFF